jgi:hypothetical protein
LIREKNFDFAQIALEISILLASISIIAVGWRRSAGRPAQLYSPTALRSG